MNIQKFTQKSVEAINDCEKLAYEYGNQEIEQEHLLVALLQQEDGLILKLIEKMDIQKEHFLDNAKKHLAARVKVSGGQVYVGQDLNKVLIHAEDEAKQMLARLSGRTHDVFTGVCILWTDSDTQEEIHGNTFHCHTKVTFYPMTEEEIDNYVATGDCMDKAGAYGIQSGAAKYIQGIEGDYLNVVGLPLSKIYHVLREKLINLTIKM